MPAAGWHGWREGCKRMQIAERNYSYLIWAVPLTLTGFAILFLFDQSPLAGLAAVLCLGVGTICLKWPNLATLAVIFAIYADIPAVASEFHHVPKIVAGSVGFLLLVPLFDRLIVKKERIIFDRIFLLMLLYLASMLVSTIFARKLGVAARTVLDFAFEGLVVYFLVDNVIRDLTTLKRAIAMVLLAGSLMGGLSVFQKVTHTEANNYGGFAQMGGVFAVGMSWGKQALQVRSEGPIGEQNRYAQVLVVLIPLAFLLFLKGKTWPGRLGAAIAGVLIFGGVVLAFSRGAYLGLFISILFLAGMRYVKFYQLAILGMAALVLFVFTSSDFTKRLQTLEQVPALLTNASTTGQAADESMRRRLAENIAAFEVFRDHPLFGVGPGHFAPFYSTSYVARLGLATQQKGFLAHNCYLEIAADTGAFGLFSFLTIVFVLVHGLWSRWRRLRWIHPDLALMSAAFFLSCMTYLITAVFLQLAYQRYFWLLVALASAAARLVDEESRRRDSMAEQELELAANESSS
jgi:O-antigen ligase